MLRVLRHGRLKLRNDRRLALWEELNSRASRLMERRGCRLGDASPTCLPPAVPRSFSSLPQGLWTCCVTLSTKNHAVL